jgi:hypothetical protein
MVKQVKKNTAQKAVAKKVPVKPARSSVNADNVSKRYPNGRTLKTKDEYLPTSQKGSSTNPKEKRHVAVVDSNRNDELAVVRMTTQKQQNTTPIRTYKKGNGKETYFKHFVEIADNEGKPIKVDGVKFIENPCSFDLSKNELQAVQKKVFKHTVQSPRITKNIVY